MSAPSHLPRVATGIPGFDDATHGGLPHGRATLVVGGPGSGKTLFGLQVLAHRRRAHGEAGIFVTFEEPPAQVVANTAELGLGLDDLRDDGLTLIDAQLADVVLDGGAFDLLGLLARLDAEVEGSGARMVVFDGLEGLLDHLPDALARRREVFRLRAWLHRTGMTGLLTAKAPRDPSAAVDGDTQLEYIADAVLRLENRVIDGTALRFLRIAKYRGGQHATNELNFTIGVGGIELTNVASARLEHPAPDERISSGVARLDAMLDGGYHRGSSVLLSGAPGTAKTTLAGAFAAQVTRAGERCLFVSFDEAPAQVVRNLRSVGVDLQQGIDAGTLLLVGRRTTSSNPDLHVVEILRTLEEFGARHLVIDPLSALTRLGDVAAERAATAVLDHAKHRGVTCLSTSLLAASQPLGEQTSVAISALADTWMQVSYVNQGGERNRALTIIKSRGTAHSNQVRELVLSREGVNLSDVYMAGGEVLMGTLRWEKEMEVERLRQEARFEADRAVRAAELALAEAAARGRSLQHTQALAEAELERARRHRDVDEATKAQLRRGVSSRRGGPADGGEEPVA